MTVSPIASTDEFQAAVREDKITIVDFWGANCPPCKLIGPEFENFAETHATEGVVFKSVNVEIDGIEDAARAFGVTCIPTFMAFKGGEKLGEHISNGKDKGALEAFVIKHVA